MADVSGRCCPTDEESGRFAPFSPTFPPEKGKKKKKSGILLTGPVLKSRDLNIWYLFTPSGEV